ncbi:MAG: hypothetical protein ACI84K_000245 [Pseudohongiellaceae bacterium]|jgi:hypothetical protein
MIDFETRPTETLPITLINSIEHVRRNHDSRTLLKMMEKISGKDAVVWGEDTIGFGYYEYAYKTGRKGKWPILSFTPSIQSITIQVMPGYDDYIALIEKIGRVKFNGNALILHKFSDIKLPALEALLKKAVYDIRQNHTCG